MNALFVAFLCVGVASAHYIGGHEDGQWKGEGLAESQDNGQYDHGYGAHSGAYAGAYAHGAAPLGHDGQVVDTPEVAHAKAAHYAAKSAAANGAHGHYAPAAHAYAYGGHEDGQWKGEGLAESQDNGDYNHGYGAESYSGAYAGAYAHGAAPLGHDGRVVDTPEVAHAKAAHLAALASASHGSYGAYAAPAYSAYAAPAYAAYAVPALSSYNHAAAPLGHDGRVVDTPEVAHAKAAHLAALASASHGAHGHHY